MIHTSEIAGVLLNSLANIKDYKLLILRRVIIIIIKLIAYKLLNISLLKLLLIL